MGVINPGDEDLHYCDGAHRWVCPYPGADAGDERAWRERVEAHMAAHRTADGETTRRAGAGPRITPLVRRLAEERGH